MSALHAVLPALLCLLRSRLAMIAPLISDHAASIRLRRRLPAQPRPRRHESQRHIFRRGATARAARKPRVYCLPPPFSARARPASGTRSSCLTLAPQPLRTRRYASRQPGATFLKDPTEPMNRALERACERHGLKIIGHVPAGLPHQDARIDEVQHLLPERSRRRWRATPWSTAPPAGTRSTSGGWTTSAGSA